MQGVSRFIFITQSRVHCAAGPGDGTAGTLQHLYNLIGLHFAMAVNDNHYADESQGAGRISNLNLSIVSGPGNDIATTLQ